MRYASPTAGFRGASDGRRDVGDWPAAKVRDWGLLSSARGLRRVTVAGRSATPCSGRGEVDTDRNRDQRAAA